MPFAIVQKTITGILGQAVFMSSSIAEIAAMAKIKHEVAQCNAAAKHRLEAFRIAYLKSIPKDNFDHALWQSVKIESATYNETNKAASAVYTLTAPDKYCNFTHNMVRLGQLGPNGCGQH